MTLTQEIRPKGKNRLIPDCWMENISKLRKEREIK